MKKSRVLFMTFIALIGLSFNCNVKALENDNEDKQEEVVEVKKNKDGVSEERWETVEPITKTTSEGLEVVAEITGKWSDQIKITVTIPEDYDKESIIINPDFFGEIAKGLGREVTHIMPGDSYYMTLEIINNSKYNYNYDEKSFDIFPTEQKTFTKVSDVKLFNGLTPTDLNQFVRVINNAYKALGFKKSAELTNSNINEKLISKGYTGIDELAKYMITYYNEQKGTNYTSLEQFDNATIEAILGGQNSFDQHNFTLETNGELLKLHYDYFYNVLVGFTTDGSKLSSNYKDKSKKTYPTEDNSIGEYMRDENKGEEDIKESIGTLESDSTSSLSMGIFFNGEHIRNAYQGYEFDIEMQLEYSAEHGTVTIKHVDKDGNLLAPDELLTGMTGKKFKTSKKEIEGYSFKSVDGEENGIYNNGNIVVTYVYNKLDIIKKPITNTEDVFTSNNGVEVMPPYTGINANNAVVYSIVSSIILGSAIILKKKIFM